MDLYFWSAKLNGELTKLYHVGVYNLENSRELIGDIIMRMSVCGEIFEVGVLLKKI